MEEEGRERRGRRRGRGRRKMKRRREELSSSPASLNSERPRDRGAQSTQCLSTSSYTSQLPSASVSSSESGMKVPASHRHGGDMLFDRGRVVWCFFVGIFGGVG